MLLFEAIHANDKQLISENLENVVLSMSGYLDHPIEGEIGVLQYAAMTGNLDLGFHLKEIAESRNIRLRTKNILRLVLSHGMNRYSNDTSKVVNIFDKAFDFFYRKDEEQIPKVEITHLLGYLMKKGNVELIRTLMISLKVLSNPHFKDSNGDGILHFACTQANPDLLSIFENSWGPRIYKIIDSTNNDGCAAVHVAAKKGHHEVVGWLISRGADLVLKDNYQETPLRHAIHNNKKGVIKEILHQVLGKSFGFWM